MSSNNINFIHKDTIVEIKNPDPNETLLNYIRIKFKKNWNQRGLCRRWLWRMHSGIW